MATTTASHRRRRSTITHIDARVSRANSRSYIPFPSSEDEQPTSSASTSVYATPTSSSSNTPLDSPVESQSFTHLLTSVLGTPFAASSTDTPASPTRLSLNLNFEPAADMTPAYQPRGGYQPSFETSSGTMYSASSSSRNATVLADPVPRSFNFLYDNYPQFPHASMREGSSSPELPPSSSHGPAMAPRHHRAPRIHSRTRTYDSHTSYHPDPSSMMTQTPFHPNIRVHPAPAVERERTHSLAPTMDFSMISRPESPPERDLLHPHSHLQGHTNPRRLFRTPPRKILSQLRRNMDPDTQDGFGSPIASRSASANSNRGGSGSDTDTGGCLATRPEFMHTRSRSGSVGIGRLWESFSSPTARTVAKGKEKEREKERGKGKEREREIERERDRHGQGQVASPVARLTHSRSRTKGKGKGKLVARRAHARTLDGTPSGSSHARQWRDHDDSGSESGLVSDKDYSSMAPLDGEEGELISLAPSAWGNYAGGDAYSVAISSTMSHRRSTRMSSNMPQSGLTALPTELLLQILCLLPFSGVRAMSYTCRRMYILADDNAVWRSLWEARSGPADMPPPELGPMPPSGPTGHKGVRDEGVHGLALPERTETSDGPRGWRVDLRRVDLRTERGRKVLVQDWARLMRPPGVAWDEGEGYQAQGDGGVVVQEEDEKDEVFEEANEELDEIEGTEEGVDEEGDGDSSASLHTLRGSACWSSEGVEGDGEEELSYGTEGGRSGRPGSRRNAEWAFDWDWDVRRASGWVDAQFSLAGPSSNPYVEDLVDAGSGLGRESTGWGLDYPGPTPTFAVDSLPSVSTLVAGDGSSNLGQEYAVSLAESEHGIYYSRRPGIVDIANDNEDMEALDGLEKLDHVPSLLLDWRKLYRGRALLERRWRDPEGEPHVTRIEGHSDSVYCLDFDSGRIITGSRDHTIKVWCIASGRCLATFEGHQGSVLCLKFEKDWDLRARTRRLSRSSRAEAEDQSDDDNDEEEGAFHGLMVSGSSDCTVRVWELVSAPSPEDTGDGGAAHVIRAEVKQVLEDHSAGVLDLRMNERWIVSCSKDTLIHVYSRDTLELVHVLRGHEGPVNAIAGLDSEVDSSGRLVSHVVSASGDGKMILWDVESGERIRVFEGHDRGLACIEFKNDLILSGSNDCTIKLWRASTGECLHTFAGHTMLVRALCFDPHTGYIVSASYDRTVRVWEWREGENAYARERGWPTGDGESRTSTSSATSTRTTASRRSKTQGAGRLIREFRNLHASHIFDVKFDVGKIVSTSHDQKIVVMDFTYDIEGAELFV